VNAESDIEKRILDHIRANIPSIAEHLVATRDMALEINSALGDPVLPEKVGIAGLCHDLARLVVPEGIPGELRKRGIDPESLGYVHPILLHGFLGAEIAREEFGIDDGEILDAIRHHVTGRAGMTLIEKIVYVADKVDRTRKFPGIETLRNLALTDFDRAVPEVIAWVIGYVVAEKLPLDYNSVAAYNAALNDLNKH